jgi:hypothetical protein
VSEHGEVDLAIAVHVKGVGAGHSGEVGLVAGLSAELESTSGGSDVAKERGRVVPSGEVEVGAVVGVAVEDCHSTADEEVELSVVDVFDAGAARLFDEARGW